MFIIDIFSLFCFLGFFLSFIVTQEKVMSCQHFYILFGERAVFTGLILPNIIHYPLNSFDDRFIMQLVDQEKQLYGFWCGGPTKFEYFDSYPSQIVMASC